MYYGLYQLKPIRIEPRLSTTALRKHSFLNENYIMSIVASAIQIQKITWIDNTHFEVKGKRKKNGDYV